MKTFISFLILCLIATCNAELRTWTAVNGKEVEAEFVSIEKGIVKLKLKSGKVFEVPFDKLSELDQEFLKAKPSSASLADNIVGKLMTFEMEDNEFQIQFNGNGIMLSGAIGNLEDLGLTYKIKDNEVLVFNEEERDGGISFSSSSPKVGDQVEWGPEEEKMKAKITKIESEIRSSIKELKNNTGEIIKVKYLTKSDEITMVGCDKKASGNLLIPEKIDGKPVTSIANNAFQYCDNLLSVLIPDSVINIGNYSFTGCGSLKNITIGNGVTKIGMSAFSNCPSLTSIKIPNNVISIGPTMFSGCVRLENVIIGKGVKNIGYGAFYTRSLETVTFLGDAPDVGEKPFDGATTIYRKPDAKGWSDTWGGRPVKLISDKPVAETKPELEGVDDKAIVGKWERQGIIFIFNEDGTGEISSNGRTIDTGTWSIKDGKIHTVNSGEFGPRGRVVIYSLSAEGHLQPPSGGSVFKKIK